MKDPCSICELYSSDIKCDQYRSCPVGRLKAENTRLKNKIEKMEQEKSWDMPSDCIGWKNDMGW